MEIGRTTGRKCDGYAHGAVSRKDLIPLQAQWKKSPRERKRNSVIVPVPKFDPFEDDSQRRHFDFFRSKTAPFSNSFVSSSFWSHLVFQTALEEPTIQHGVLALSAWHSYFESRDEANVSYAVEQYNRALKYANTLLRRANSSNHDLILVMTALVIFHCVQNCFGDYATSESSLKTARKLANDFELYRTDPDMKEIILTVNRLDIHSITFSDASAPYEFPEVFSTSGLDHQVPEYFEDVEQCLRILLVILRDSFHVHRLQFLDEYLPQDTMSGLGQISVERSRSLYKLRRWWDLSFELEDRRGKQETMTMALMRVYHTVAMLALCKGTSESELDWDLYLPHHVYILDTVSSILEAPREKHPVSGDTPFSCELGIICPLFFIASNCREPLMRRKAVALLLSTRRREGRWESISAAVVAQRLIEIEEEGLEIVTQPSDIPESKRIAFVEPRVCYERGRAEVSFVIPAAPTPSMVVRSEVIYL